MKRDMKLTTILAAVLLAGAVSGFAEVALDEVVQAGRFVFYRDHADPHRYYYVPDAPRLAVKRDGTPEFTFIKYTKTGGETRGGVVHFLVTWGYTSGELSAAESALKSSDPQARIAGPVPFKEGTFQVVSATAGEGGLFNRRIVGEGKAPVLPGQKAAVSIALTEEGASLLWESFKNPTSDVSVLFALKFTGVTPAFQAKLKVDWDKVYTHHDVRVAAEGTIKVVKLRAEMQAILDELRQKGVIQLDVVGENENMQKMLDAVYTHILNMMCEPVPTGARGAAPSPPVKGPVAELGPPAWSLDVLADLVRASGERFRGGPLWDQEQAAGSARASSFCDEPSRQSAEAFERRAAALIEEAKYAGAVEMLEKAYAACPDPRYKHVLAGYADMFLDRSKATQLFQAFLDETVRASGFEEEKKRARAYLDGNAEAPRHVEAGEAHFGAANAHFATGIPSSGVNSYYAAVQEFTWLWDKIGALEFLWNMGLTYVNIGEPNRDRYNLLNALRCFQGILDFVSVMEGRGDYFLEDANKGVREVRKLLGPDAPSVPDTGPIPATRQPPVRRAQPVPGAVAAETARAEQTQADIEAARRAQRQTATSQRPDSSATLGPQTQGPERLTALRQWPLEGGTKPPTGQEQAAAATAGQAQQQTAAQAGATAPPATGQTPPVKPAGQAQQATAAQPAAAAPEVKPIVSVSLGYTFKRVKMSGRYEVDMRKRLREDRDIVMSGNIGGVFQKYGEDKRFFTVVSLDDPTFQERSVEVILDGQDAEDFKSFVNTVSVLFRKQRFSGAPMTGEVKFFADQFAQSGNRLSFRYGRLNEASTEWLTYEYKPKWSFFGGVEWEGEWTKTSDSVLTLAPPVRRRTLEISVDEDNILKNSVKALAIQIRHEIYGKEIVKEVIIDYDKGDPLQARYTYMHEEGSPRYSYKVIWLTTDGREVETGWMSRESPFIYAVFAKR